ncbi:hypothetical protein DMH17_04680 [Raoultella planticola]|nr:hypothetical protein [Raoultella planticola]
MPIRRSVLPVSETQVDCLAAALGSTHGLYKGKAKLGFAEMKAISELVKVPLVLHGGLALLTTIYAKRLPAVRQN